MSGAGRGLAWVLFAAAAVGSGACRRSPDMHADGGGDALDAGDGAPGVSCEAVRALAALGVLTPRRARQVLFAPGGIVLRVAGEVPVEGGFIPDDILYLRLPDGVV